MDQFKRIAVLADDAMTPQPTKTLAGILRDRADRVIAVIDRHNAGLDAGDVVGLGHGIPVLADVTTAVDHDPDAVLLATEGSLRPYHREQLLIAAMTGIDVITGGHARFADDDEIATAARRSGARIWDAREDFTERFAIDDLRSRRIA